VGLRARHCRLLRDPRNDRLGEWRTPDLGDVKGLVR
jgi:hypothetical protein